MSQLSNMLVMFFTMFTSLFSAGNKFASALDNIGTVADESSAQYADDARTQRQINANNRKRELIASQDLPAITG